MFGDLVGRDAEIGALCAALDRARSQATLVLVEGEAGIGKTALVEALLDAASHEGTTVYTATAHPFETDRPFAAVIDALDLWRAFAQSDTAASLSPGVFGLAADARYRLIDLVCTHVEAAAAERPVALVIEDLHLCDASALLVLRAIRRRLAGHPLLIVGTTRPVSVDPEAQRTIDLLRGEADTHLRLRALDADAVAQLARRRLHSTSVGPRLRRHLAAAEGTPLLLFELLDDLDADAQLVRSTGGVDLAAGVSRSAAGPTLAGSVDRRMSRCSEDAAALLHAGAVLGTSFDVRLAGELAKLKPSATAAAARQLAAAGFVVGTADPARFRHDLVRDAVVDLLPHATRAALHLGAADLLARHGAPAAVVAAHIESGGGAADRLVPWLVRAATEAELRSPATAHRLYARAVEVMASDDPRRDEVELGRLSSASCAGLCTEAERYGAELLARPLDATLALRARWWLAGVQLLRNRPGEAATLYEAAAADPVVDPVDAARCAAMAAICHVLAFDDRIVEAAAVADAAASSTGDAVARTVAAMAAARAAAFAGRFDEALELGAHAVAVADEDATGGAHRYQPHVVHAFALLDLGRWDELAVTLEAGRRRCQENGTSWAEALFHGFGAVAALYTGRLDDAATHAETGLRVADDGGVRLMAAWCHCVLALVHQHQGENDAAARWLASADAELTGNAGQIGADLAALARARSLCDEGRDDEAVEQLRGVLDFALAVGVPTLGLSVLPDLVALGVRRGSAAELAAAASFAREAAATGELALFSWVLDTVAAAGLQGTGEGPIHVPGSQLVPDRSAFLRTRPLSAANLEIASALRALASGDRATAQRLARRAERTLHERGAHGDLRRARRSLPDIDRRGRPPRQLTSGWGSLTATESYVAAQLAEGCSNRAIAERSGMSTRTVETHVSRVLRKLGLTSRSQVAVAARSSV